VSRIRRTPKTAPLAESVPTPSGPRPSPRWWVPTLLTLMLIGLIWIVVFYLSSSTLPVPDIGAWNLVIGFGLIIVGFGMTTRWR
jgi:hypothetical protein